MVLKAALSARADGDRRPVHRFHLLWIVGACLVIGCAANVASPPVSQTQSIARGVLPNRATGNNEVRPGAGPQIALSDLNSGTVTKALFRGPNAGPIAIHNGSNLWIDVQADPGVIGVILSGDDLTPMLLRRASSGHWQGSFQYWDSSNKPNSQSEITVRLDSARSSMKRTISVTTVHDS